MLDKDYTECQNRECIWEEEEPATVAIFAEWLSTQKLNLHAHPAERNEDDVPATDEDSLIEHDYEEHPENPYEDHVWKECDEELDWDPEKKSEDQHTAHVEKLYSQRTGPIGS